MLVVVGGHSRSVGKTSVICGLIRALRNLRWTAVKITQYGHNVCAADGEACECADLLHPVMISREAGAKPNSDSGRFLEAGAERAYWLRTAGGELAEGLPALRRLLAEGGNFIIESNSLIQFLRPDAYILVVDGANPDFKPSSRRVLDRVDFIADTSGALWQWEGVPNSLLSSKPRYPAPGPCYESEQLAQAVAQRMKSS